MWIREHFIHSSAIVTRHLRDASVTAAKLATGAISAAIVTLADAAGLYDATTVEAAFAELRTSVLMKAATTLTVATGVVTATQSYHILDTEAAAASDDVDTINGLVDGQMAYFKNAANARNIVLKHGTGNLLCEGGVDITLDVTGDLVEAFRSGSSVMVRPLRLATSTGGGLGALLASIVTGRGSSLLGVEDAAALYAGANVEAILAEIRQITGFSGTPVTQTIAGGAISVTTTNTLVDTEGAAASDDLDTVSFSAPGFFILRPASGARTVVVKNSATIKTPAGMDCELLEATDFVFGFWNGTVFYVLKAYLDREKLVEVTADYLAIATIAVADASGGATDAALTVDLYRQNGSTPISSARYGIIRASATEFSASPDNSVTFSAATKGTIILAGSGFCVFETDTNGEFDCTATNATDETLYFSVGSQFGGIPTMSKACHILGSNTDAATWSA